MAIEFFPCDVTGLGCFVHRDEMVIGLIIEQDKMVLYRTYADISTEELEKILNKMKELREEKK